MPIFKIKENKLELAASRNFKVEKELQNLIEKNLETVFNCRFIASEFPTGPEHGGRIDTLALSEDEAPVIIVYKEIESSEIVSQGLFYRSWLMDHKGDFQLAVNAKLGTKIVMDWSDVKVICIAPRFKKFDRNAAKTIGSNIELWKYQLFENGGFYLEAEQQKDSTDGYNNDEVIK